MLNGYSSDAGWIWDKRRRAMRAMRRAICKQTEVECFAGQDLDVGLSRVD